MPDLFRQEALDHQRQKLYGTILLARPLSFTVLTALFVAVAVATVAFFFLFGFNRKATVPGVLLPDQGLVRIYIGTVMQDDTLFRGSIADNISFFDPLPMNERAVNEAIKDMKLTRIIVAHRPETIAMASRVVVIDRGKALRDLELPHVAPAGSDGTRRVAG